MNLDEYETYISLPDSFTVYRGVGSGRNPDGMSWTNNLDSAKWFASRFGDDGYVIRGIVKEKSFMYQEELITV